MSVDARVAWAAGIFEGEGCFTLDKGRTLRAVLTMTDEDVVRSFAEIVGVGTVIRLRARPRRKAMWRWHTHGSGGEAVGELFRPFLHARRQQRLDEILAAIAAHRSRATVERTCKGCGERFQPPFGSNAARTLFCSRRCKDAAHHRGGELVCP